MKKLILLSLTLSALISPARADFRDFKGVISCAVLTGLSYALIKDSPEKVSAVGCGAILSYDLIESTTLRDEAEIKKHIEKVAEETQEMVIKNHIATKQRYDLYRKVIREAIVKRFKRLEKKIDSKMKTLNSKSFRRNLQKDINKVLEMKVEQSIGIKREEDRKLIKKESENLIPKIIDETIEKIKSENLLKKEVDDLVKEEIGKIEEERLSKEEEMMKSKINLEKKIRGKDVSSRDLMY